jgi:hypothetical protein
MNPELITHYYNTPLYLTHFEKTGKSGGFIKLPFQHPKSLVDPNIITYPQLEKFKTTNMFIFRKSMNIPDYDAELVIEHVSSTNFGTPIYVVFLLKKTKNAQWSAIDDVIAASSNTLLGEKPTSIHLDKLVATAIQNDCLTNVNGSVYVLVHPIPISSTHTLDDLTVSNTMLLEHSFNLENAVKCRVASFQDVHTKNMLSGDKPVIEGMETGDSVEFDCRPADIDGESKVLMTVNDLSITDSLKLKSSMVMLIIFSMLTGIIFIIFLTVFKQFKTNAAMVEKLHVILRLLILSIVFSGFMMFIKSNSAGISIGTSLIFIASITYVLLRLVTKVFVPGTELLEPFHRVLFRNMMSSTTAAQASGAPTIPINPAIIIIIIVVLLSIGSILVGVFAGLPKFKRSNKPGPKAGLAIGIIFMVFGGLFGLAGLFGFLQKASDFTNADNSMNITLAIAIGIIVLFLSITLGKKVK